MTTEIYQSSKINKKPKWRQYEFDCILCVGNLCIWTNMSWFEWILANRFLIRTYVQSKHWYWSQNILRQIHIFWNFEEVICFKSKVNIIYKRWEKNLGEINYRLEKFSDHKMKEEKYQTLMTDIVLIIK